MNAAVPVEAPPWSRQRWIVTVVLGVAVQIGLMLWLSERSQPALPPEKVATAIHLAVDEWSAARLSEMATMTDPTVFALPSHRGFSGSAWLRFAPPEYQLTDWSEPNRWLELDAAGLGKSFSRFVATSHSPPLRIADKPAPKPALDEMAPPNLPMRTQSQLRILGDLARRPLLAPLTPPSWPHYEILRDTAVELFVNADGFTVSTVLLAEKESGSRAADQYALELARGARFAPMRGPKGEKPPDSATLVTRGRMMILWHTLPALNTNTPPLTP